MGSTGISSKMAFEGISKLDWCQNMVATQNRTYPFLSYEREGIRL
jgi:hypothetical protein